MNPTRTCSGIACALLMCLSPVQAQEGPGLLSQLNWVKGPGKASMRSVAQVDVPAGYMFTGDAGTKKLMEAMGNIVSGQEIGFLAPTSMVWFVVFEFDPVGYVKDDEKDKLNPDAMLKAIREGTEAANKQREKMGVPPMHIVGWELPPRYNPETHNLEWSIRGESEGQTVLNHNTRLLGRKGVMRVTLVAEPTEMPAAMPGFKSLLAGYTFQSGQNYAEYKPGDKVAKYGLAALVVGGAAVGAAKLGLLGPILLFLKKGWKVLVVAFVALIGFFRKIFARLMGRRNAGPTGAGPTS